MAYKNTDGSSSISNEWGQWRYFNSAVEKLGAVKPAKVSINIPKLDVPEGDNWMGAIGGALKAGQDIWEAKTAYSNKKAEEYFKTHSLEQYQADMKAGSVPFQDDFLAMDALKTMHGNMLMQTVASDFMDRVNKNEFLGMTPTEVDQKFHEFAQQSLKGAAQDFGYQPDDAAFTRGFYSDSPDKRLKSMLQQKVVENNYNTQKAFTTDVATVSTLIINGANGETVLNTLTQIESVHGRFWNMEQRSKFLEAIFTTAENSEKGTEILAYLKDKPVPGLGGITYRDLAGIESYNLSEVKAKNFIDLQDTRKHLAWEDSLQTLAIEGKYQVIEGLLQSELANNGNKSTKRVEILNKWRDQAYNHHQTIAKAQFKEEQAKQEKAIEDLAMGHDIVEASKGMAIDTSLYKTKDFYNNTKKLIEAGQLDMVAQLRLARNTSIPKGANYCKERFTMVADTVEGAMNAMSTANMAGMEHSFTTEEKVAIKEFQDVFVKHPAEAVRVFGLANDNDASRVMKTLSMVSMLTNGRPIEDVVKARQVFNTTFRAGTTESNIALKHLRDMTISGVVEIANPDGKTKVDALGKAFIYGVAASNLANGAEDVNKAISMATDTYRDTFVDVFGCSVPKAWFMKDDQDNPAEYLIEDAITSFAERVTKELPEDADIKVTFNPTYNHMFFSDAKSGKLYFGVDRAYIQSGAKGVTEAKVAKEDEANKLITYKEQLKAERIAKRKAQHEKWTEAYFAAADRPILDGAGWQGTPEDKALSDSYKEASDRPILDGAGWQGTPEDKALSEAYKKSYGRVYRE